MSQLTVTPYSFGHPDANEPVTIPGSGISVIYQTVRDDDIFDDEYRGKLLTRIVRSGLEIMVDEPVSAVVARWAADESLRIARLTRGPTDKPDDDPLVAVNAARVTDVCPVLPGQYPEVYRTVIGFGGLRVPVTQAPDVVRQLLDGPS